MGNLGTQEGSIWWALGGAYAAYPLCLYLEDETTWFSLMVVGSAMAFDNMSKKWRRKPRKTRSIPARVLVLVLCGALYLGTYGNPAYRYTYPLPPNVTCSESTVPTIKELMACMSHVVIPAT